MNLAIVIVEVMMTAFMRLSLNMILERAFHSSYLTSSHRKKLTLCPMCGTIGEFHLIDRFLERLAFVFIHFLKKVDSVTEEELFCHSRTLSRLR